MRLGQFIGVAFVAFALTGSATEKPVTSISFFNKMRPLKPIPGPEMVQIDIALLERPLHDRFLNNELWLLADEQIIPLERKAYLEEAGFRIGQVNGLNPSGLQTMLTSSAVASSIAANLPEQATLCCYLLVRRCRAVAWSKRETSEALDSNRPIA